MNTRHNSKPVKAPFPNGFPWMFPILTLITGLVSLHSFFSPTLYGENFYDVFVRAKYYDLTIFSFAIPISCVTLFFLLKRNIKAQFVSYGIALYLAFSYGITVFTCFQNQLFIPYILILLLSVFHFVLGALSSDKNFDFEVSAKTKTTVGIILIFSATSGYVFWIVDAIIALLSPESTLLPAKAPQVLDMVIVLPLSIYGAILLLKNKSTGILISLMTVVFFILIGFSVVGMEIGYTYTRQTEIDHGKVFSYMFIFLINIVAFGILYKNTIVNKR